MKRFIPLFLPLMLLFSTYLRADNIIANAGFESGSLSGWTSNMCTTGSCGASGWFVTSFNPHDGTFSASDQCVSADCLNPTTGDFISQSLSTVTGKTYDLSFWYRPGAGTGAAELDVYWNGTSVAALANKTAGVYDFYTISGLSATSASSVLQFNARQDMATLFLDSVSLSASDPVTSTPEPVSAAMAGGALALLGLLRRKRHA